MSDTPSSAPALPAVVHNTANSRFELQVDGLLSVCEYHRTDNTLIFTHTEVPPALNGRGIAAALVKAALSWAASEGLKVRPLCSYVASYMRRHSETQHLLA